MDYVGPDIEPEEVREAMRLKRQAVFRLFFRQKLKFSTEAHQKNDLDQRSIDALDEKGIDYLDETSAMPTFIGDATTATPTAGSSSPLEKAVAHERLDSLERTNTMTAINIQQADNNLNTVHDIEVQLTAQNQNLPLHCTSTHSSTHSLPLNNNNNHQSRLATRQSIRNFFKNLLNPPSIAIFISFPIALVPQLKALFTQVPGTYIPSAPDGQPPLAFILDATTFMGAASVPLGLICLGSALARLQLPKKGEWRTLPLGAIGSLAMCRLLVMPVLGVLICEGLTNIGVISKDDKVLRFVCM